MPPHKRGRSTVNGKTLSDAEDHNEFASSDEENNETDKRRPTKRGKLNQEEDEPTNQSVKTTPPRSHHKSSTIKGPNTPSLLANKSVKYSESTPDSTPRSKSRKVDPDTVQEGGVKCLSDFVEKEGEKYLRRLERVANSSESEKHSVEELVKSGAKLSEHSWKIHKLGNRFLSLSEDRLNKKQKQPS